MEIEPVDAEERAKAAGRRGTQDLGLLLLRVAIGAVFIAHGLQKAFGWWGGQGIDGFKTALADAGYQHAGVLTYVGAGAQIVVGVLLVLGLFTPLAAAGALAYLVNSLLTIISAQRHDGDLSVFGADGTNTCWSSSSRRPRSSWSAPAATGSTPAAAGPAARSSARSSR